MSNGRRERIRIAYVIGSLRTGGAEQQLVRLANGLDRERFEASIICLVAGGELSKEVRSDVTVHRASLENITHRRVRSRILLGMRLFRAVMKEIRRHRPHVLHAYMPAAYVLCCPAAWLLRVPAIVAGRRSLVTYYNYPQVHWRLLAWVANHLIHIQICNSQAVRSVAVEVEQLPVRKTAVIPNGIDLAARDTVPALPAEWGIQPDHIAAVSLANLHSYKGHQTLLGATAEVVREFARFRLVLIGDGPERPKLESEVKRLGLTDHVVLAGSVPVAARLLPHFLFLTLASYQEGFPNAVMEAMAAGVPVIASAVGGVPELIRDGVDGVLVPPADRQALARAMLRLLRDSSLRRGLGTAGRERIASTYSVDAMVKATQETYLGLLSRRGRKIGRLAVER